MKTYSTSALLALFACLGLSACGTVTADVSPDAGGDVGGAGGNATGGSAGLASGGFTGTGGAVGTGGAASETGGSPGSGGMTGTGGIECTYTICGSPPGCVDTAYDGNNCGSCGHVCGFGKLCVGATCIDGPTGTGGATGTGGGTGGSCSGHLCSGACVNISSDRLNCGSCGVVCTGGKSCVNGACSS